MAAGHNDPRLLYSVNNVLAFHIQDGDESSLAPSGPQTLSLLMVPTSSPFADLSTADPQSAAPEEDFYLHLHLPPELDLALPATTQIYHQPPRSYLIPRWDLGPDSGAFTRIEFQRGVSQEDIDTFETIIAQCTAFLERAKAPSGKGTYGVYNPGDYAPGEGYIGSDLKGPQKGHIILVDEEDGSVVGELGQGFNLIEGSDMKPGQKNPVEIELPQEGRGNIITVNNVSEEYLRLARHPAYKDSSLVQNAAMASRLIVTGSTALANAMNQGAQSFTQKTKPNSKPMTFTPTTQARVRKLNNITGGAVALSAKTVGQIGRYAQNMGATMTRRGEQKSKDGKLYDKDGRPVEAYKPGLLNKSMIAFSTIADGIDHGARQLLASSSTAATTMVGHRYGPDARNVASHIAGGFKNVGLVYVDAAGVSRKAVIKSVAKGMVVGKMPNGGNLVVGGGNGGTVPPEFVKEQSSRDEKEKKGYAVQDFGESSSGSGQPQGMRPGYESVGFGNQNQAPPAYESGVGEPLGSGGYPLEKYC
ncbi:MAG: hypothetical protein MMC33_008945 [Icmadophila ericetorum]|nr:hypothetical protein [Icmadophila ericetorum]